MKCTRTLASNQGRALQSPPPCFVKLCHMAKIFAQLLWVVLAAILATACTGRPALHEAQPAPPLHWQAMDDGLRNHAAVAALAFDPHVRQRVAAGLYTPAGLLLSTDGGATWRSDGGMGEPVHRIHFDRMLPNVLWIASAHGLWRGDYRAGEWQWQPATGWPADHAAFTVTQSPDGVRYAAGVARWGEAPVIWRSTDGEVWRPLSSLPTPDDSAVLALAATGERLLAGTDGYGLFVSDDSVAWRRAEEIGETHVAAIWADEDGALLLARTRKGLFRSTDAGGGWQPVMLPVDSRPDAIAGAPDGSLHLGMSSGEILRSVDLGASWQRWSALDRDGLFYALTVDPLDATRLLAGTQHGLYASQGSGRTWWLVESVGERRGLTLREAGDALFLGAEDGVYRWSETTHRWENASDGLPIRSVRALAASPENPSILFAGTDAGLYRSLDAGAMWRLVGWSENGVHGLRFDPDDPNRLYVRIAFGRVYSTDEALSEAPTWNARWEGMPASAEILSLEMEPGNPQRLYAGAAQGLFLSDDRAERWRSADALIGRSVFIVVVDPTHPQRVYVGATDGLHRSEDRGETWERLGLKDVTVTALAWSSRQPQILYAGTKYQGLWRSQDAGHTWEQVFFDDVMENNESIYDLLISADGRWLYVATTRGVWRAELRLER